MLMYLLTRILPLCLVLLVQDHRHRCPVHIPPGPVSQFYELELLLCRPEPHFHLPFQSLFHFLFLHPKSAEIYHVVLTDPVRYLKKYKAEINKGRMIKR